MRKTKEGKWILSPARPHDQKEKILSPQDRLVYLDKLDIKIDLDETDLYSYYEFKGIAHKELGNIDEATECFTKALEIADKIGKKDQGIVAVHSWRGEIYWKRKEYEKAIVDFQKAVEYDYDHTAGLEELAKIYIEISQVSKAKTIITELLEKTENQVKKGFFPKESFEFVKSKCTKLLNQIKKLENAKK